MCTVYPFSPNLTFVAKNYCYLSAEKPVLLFASLLDISCSFSFMKNTKERKTVKMIVTLVLKDIRYFLHASFMYLASSFYKNERKENNIFFVIKQ